MKYLTIPRVRLLWSGTSLRKSIPCKRLIAKVEWWANGETRLEPKLRKTKNRLTFTSAGNRKHIWNSKRLARKKTKNWWAKLEALTKLEAWWKTSKVVMRTWWRVKMSETKKAWSREKAKRCSIRSGKTRMDLSARMERSVVSAKRPRQRWYRGRLQLVLKWLLEMEVVLEVEHQGAASAGLQEVAPEVALEVASEAVVAES